MADIDDERRLSADEEPVTPPVDEPPAEVSDAAEKPAGDEASSEDSGTPEATKVVTPQAKHLDETVAMSPEEVEALASGEGTAVDEDATVVAVEDPDATRLMSDEAATVAGDPDATRLMNDEAVTQVVPPNEGSAPDDMPTIIVPGPSTYPVEGPDGIDALDDPYAPIIDNDDFTTPVAPVSINSPVTDKGREHGRAHWWGIFIVIILIAGIVGYFVYATYENEYWGGRTVPDVVGKTESEAMSALSPLGFNVTIEYELSDDNVGKVISSTPAAGGRTGSDMAVTLKIGTARIIPTVIGESLDDAKQAIYGVGGTNIVVTYQNSDETEGTVIDVSPAEGSEFLSTDKVTLTVAQAYQVPDVVGMTLTAAIQEIEDSGLTYQVVTDSSSDADPDQVISTDPVAGTKVSSGTTVTLTVPTAKLSSDYHLLEYFSLTPTELDSYLQQSGYTCSVSWISQGGVAYSQYADEARTVQITDTPEQSELPGSYYYGSSVLSQVDSITGVRMDVSASTISSEAEISDAGLQAVMSVCGFSNLVQSCTNESAQTTANIDRENATFICGYGKQDGYVWAILIGKVYDGDTIVTIIAAPESHFSSIDLTNYGNDLASYIAVTNYYGV